MLRLSSFFRPILVEGARCWKLLDRRYLPLGPNRALPVSATYVIGCDGVIVYAYTDVDYRDRAEPREVLQFLKKKSIAA